jgi:hypothetical protein
MWDVWSIYNSLGPQYGSSPSTSSLQVQTFLVTQYLHYIYLYLYKRLTERYVLRTQSFLADIFK